MLEHYKVLWVDTETTGFDPKTCGLLQVSGCLEIDGVICEKFNYKMRPHKEAEWTQSAIDKNGISPEMAQDFEHPSICFEQFLGMLEKYINRYDKQDKAFIVGYNVSFDEDFLRAWFTREAKTERDRMYGNGFGSYFWNPAIDVMQLAMFYLAPIRNDVKNFQLGTVCQILDIEWDEEKAHNAYYDIVKTRKLGKKLMGILNPSNSVEYPLLGVKRKTAE